MKHSLHGSHFQTKLVIRHVTLNPLRNLCGEIFYPHTKLLITWISIPIEMTDFVHKNEQNSKSDCTVMAYTSIHNGLYIHSKAYNV